MEKKIIVVSNGCTEQYENTLSSFKNLLPKDYLEMHKRWFLCIESLGFNCNFLGDPPKIIRVVCSNIQPIIRNGTFCKDILITSVSEDNFGKYTFIDVLSLEYFELQSSASEYIEIELLDENSKPLRLDFGSATLVKLHLKSEEKMNEIHMRLNSNTDNASIFRVNLPKKLQFFDKSPKVALNSIIIWNKLKRTTDLDLSFGIKNAEEERGTFYYTPNPIENLKAVLKNMKQKLRNWLYFIELSNGKIMIQAKKDLILSVGRDLAFSLGWCSNQVGSREIITLSKGNSYTPNFVKRSIPLWPTHCFLYTNIAKPSCLGGGLHHLLKVIPVSHQSSDSYTTIQFQHPEFIDISTTDVQYIDFELRTYNGNLVEFANDKAVTYLNLTIKDSQL